MQYLVFVGHVLAITSDILHAADDLFPLDPSQRKYTRASEPDLVFERPTLPSDLGRVHDWGLRNCAEGSGEKGARWQGCGRFGLFLTRPD